LLFLGIFGLREGENINSIRIYLLGHKDARTAHTHTRQAGFSFFGVKVGPGLKAEISTADFSISPLIFFHSPEGHFHQSITIAVKRRRLLF
jgi:hypothetical protein